MKNIFCRHTDLDSEADVEALVVEKLLAKLNYPDNRVRRKDSLNEIKIPRGHRKEPFRPDYVLCDQREKPTVIIDAKAPSENCEAYLYQVGGYAYGLNQRYADENPVRYVVVTNGTSLLVWDWDKDIPTLSLSFEDFEEDSQKFLQLRSLLSYGALDVVRVTQDVFQFERPDLNALIHIFHECHNIIWKKEAYGPTDAFYEFAKLIFVKLREDNRIVSKIAQGETPKATDFNFSTRWIQDQIDRGVSDNPLNEILFKNVREDLETQIQSGDKKRIFDVGERLQLRNDTVFQVVEKLEHYDLHSIDEDLNGRMFETFLNATVRGKELGQFFTPRSIVKYMCHTSDLRLRGQNLPVVLDGCCGSGGFLIEAMAVLSHAIDGRSDFTSAERRILKKCLYRKHLYGIDKANKIARIARLNMYLHGDGGSTIYTADMLDKDLLEPEGLSQEIKTEVSELKTHLVDGGLKFDVALSNPPFSMVYRTENQDEQRILSKYSIATSKTGNLASKEKSNILFLERYCDQLRDGGELLTIIDNTVLNGADSQRYREYVLEHFLLRQIIALPFNTFFRAQANVQTSIIHLKKREPGDEQGAVIMAILNNVGHDDHQRFTPDRDNIPKLIDVYNHWRETGEIIEIYQPNSESGENLGCHFQTFVVPAAEINDRRLDAFYYAPDLRRTLAELRASDGEHLEVRKGREFTVVPTMKRKEAEVCKGRIFRYFDIGDVTSEGLIVNYREDYFENLPSRGKLRVRTNDVFFAKNNSSRGTSVIIPPDFDGQIVTTGFIAVRPEDEEEALLLWSIFRSEAFRKQIYYLAITAVQPEVREDIFGDEFLLPLPRKGANRNRLIDQARRVRQLQHDTRNELEQMNNMTEKLFRGS